MHDGGQDVGHLRAAALPLARDDPVLPDDDLRPLLARLAGARLVGLGEATHGDRESFRLKHRLIQALVRHHGCRLVLFEKGVAEMDAYDQAVTGAAAARPPGPELYPWRTEEVRDLFAWLRERNAGGAAGAVRLGGVDLQNPFSLRLALRRLDEAGAPVPPAWRRLAAEAWAARDDPAWLAAARETWRTTAPLALGTADPLGRRVTLPAGTFGQWLELRPHGLQGEMDAYTRLRDHGMAENALAQLDGLAPGATAVLWAANAHVSLHPQWTGGHLRARLGPGYRAVTFAFGRGALNAGGWDAQGTPDWAQRPQPADPAPPDSLEGLLDRVGPACFAVEPGAVAPLRRPRRRRVIGGLRAPGEDFRTSEVPADVADLLVYFREAHPSRVLEAGADRDRPAR